MSEPLLTRYLQPLLAGRRAECFNLIAEVVRGGYDPRELIHDVVWPAMAQLERLYRDDRIDTAIDNMACRINHTVADQLQAHLPKRVPNGKRIVVTCGDDQRQVIGAQMLADLLQSDGWDVYFVGGAFDQAGKASRPGPDSRRGLLPVMSHIHIEPSVVANVSHFELGENEGATVYGYAPGGGAKTRKTFSRSGVVMYTPGSSRLLLTNAIHRLSGDHTGPTASESFFDCSLTESSGVMNLARGSTAIPCLWFP